MKLGRLLALSVLASGLGVGVFAAQSLGLSAKPIKNNNAGRWGSENMPSDLTRFETVPAGEQRQIESMTSMLRHKLAQDYAAGQTKRDAHPKTLACLRAEFTVDPDLPVELKQGVFAEPRTYSAWVRVSSASGAVQSDTAKDLRGLAIKLMGVTGPRYAVNNDEQASQDFLLLSYPSMPLGTVSLFHDAVYYSTRYSPVVFGLRLVLTGRFDVIRELAKARQNEASPLDIRYWSTTPYLCGPDQVVKYSLVPSSNYRSSRPAKLTDDYLTANMQTHLASQDASFDFMVQLRKDPKRMPVEDAGVEWLEADSPFIKVASLRIPAQEFRTAERAALAEDLSFSPAHALLAHRPIGGLNRARVAIYRALSDFRHQRNHRPMLEPRG